ELFTKFKQAATRTTINQLLFIESSIHELLSLSNILLLCTSQHIQLCVDIFSEDTLDELSKEILVECIDFKQDMCDDFCMKLTRFMNNADSKLQSKDDIEIDLLMLRRNLNPLQQSLLRDITAAMRKLPLIALRNKKSSVTSDESGDIRPDATISKMQQRDFEPSLGFGEVKKARSTTDNHSLCHDLLRLAALAKDTIDSNNPQAALTFQIYG
ncbi:hypothetical protein CU098_008537, partial [Rhizopus stolonifer]